MHEPDTQHGERSQTSRPAGYELQAMLAALDLLAAHLPHTVEQELRASLMARAAAAAAPGAQARRGTGSGWSSLTPAERRVVSLVAAGLPNNAIAAALHVSRHTVETHLKHVFAKLSITSRARLATEVTRREIVAGERRAT